MRYRGTLACNTASIWPTTPRRSRAIESHCDEASIQRRTARLEAVLFLAKEALSSRKIAQLASLEDGTEARTLITRLNQDYDSGGRAFRVEEVAAGYRLLTRSKFAAWVRRMVGAPTEIRLSGPASETLAVVAYRQPVLRAEIEAIRGVQCGEVLRQLMERGLVRIAGRSEDLGRPFLYGTTRNFLQVFGLRNLDELPRASMLRKSDGEQLSSDDSVESSEIEPADEAVPEESDKESAVTTTVSGNLADEQNAGKLMEANAAALTTAESTEDKDYEEEIYEDDEDDDDDEDEDDLDEYEDDLDEYEDEDEDEELDEKEADDDLENDEWEEVEDDESEDLDEEEDDDDWDDDDDDWGDDDWEDEEEV